MSVTARLGKGLGEFWNESPEARAVATAGAGAILWLNAVTQLALRLDPVTVDRIDALTRDQPVLTVLALLSGVGAMAATWGSAELLRVAVRAIRGTGARVAVTGQNG